MSDLIDPSAIKRNRGVGLQPGVWFFEEFEFMPDIIGSAKVEYDYVWRRLTKDEMPVGDTSPPFDLHISHPRVSEIDFEDTRPKELKRGRAFYLSVEFEDSLKNAVIDAWHDAEYWVLEFEMGLL